MTEPVLCPKCKHQMQVGLETCPYCRARLSGAPTQPEQRRSHGKPISPWLKVAVAIWLCLLVVVAVLARQGGLPGMPAVSDELLLLLLVPLIAGPFFAIVVTVWVVAARQVKATAAGMNEVLEAFAQQVNGTLEAKWSPAWFRRAGSRPSAMLFPPPERRRGVTFSHEGIPGRLELEWLWGRTVDLKSYPIEHYLIFQLPQPASFWCHLFPHDSGWKLVLYAGKQEARLGWPPFDDEFVVKAQDEAMATAVLTREVQEALLQLKQWVADVRTAVREDDVPGPPGHVELMLDEKSLRILAIGPALTAQNLATFYELGGQVYDEVTRQMPAREGEVEATQVGERPGAQPAAKREGGRASRVLAFRPRGHGWYVVLGILALLIANSLLGGLYFEDRWTDALGNQFLRRSTGFRTVVIAKSFSGKRSWKVSQNYLVFRTQSSSGFLRSYRNRYGGEREGHQWEFRFGRFGPDDPMPVADGTSQ